MGTFEYVSALFEEGKSRQEIKQALVAKGYDQARAEKIIDSANVIHQDKSSTKIVFTAGLIFMAFSLAILLAGFFYEHSQNRKEQAGPEESQAMGSLELNDYCGRLNQKCCEPGRQCIEGLECEEIALGFTTVAGNCVRPAGK